MVFGESASRRIINEQIQAPWNAEQVQHLKEFQECGYVHPFTGINSAGQTVDLIPTRDGWRAEPNGPIVQNWAYGYMLDGTVVASFERVKQLDREIKRSGLER